jgi:outer membrane lipoprotein SlyB
MKSTVSRPVRVTACSAVSAAAAALALAACSPNEGAATAQPAADPAAENSAQAVPPIGAAVPLVERQGAPVPQLPAQSVPSNPPIRTTPPGYATAPDDAVQPAAPQTRAVDRSRVGAITGIEPIHERPEGSGAGAVIGGVLGAVVGNQFGHGTGRAVMTGAGAVGGAIAGNNVERNQNSHVVGYRVSVRLDDGTTRTFKRSQVSNLRVGDRIELDAGSFHRV